MTPSEIRSTRLRTLLQIWKNSNGDENAVLSRAVSMGVTNATANDYLNTIKIRFPRK